MYMDLSVPRKRCGKIAAAIRRTFRACDIAHIAFVVNQRTFSRCSSNFSLFLSTLARLGRQVKKSQINSKRLEALFPCDIQTIRWQQYDEDASSSISEANEHPNTLKKAEKLTHTRLCSHKVISSL